MKRAKKERTRPLRTEIISARVDEETYAMLVERARVERLVMSELLRKIAEDAQTGRDA